MHLDLFAKYQKGLSYDDFLDQHGTSRHQANWKAVYDAAALTADQTDLLASFQRAMPVLCLAGAWCGDCVGQCPMLQRFAEATPTIQLRFLDRDKHADVQSALQINGGDRVPVVVFFSEDGYEVSRFGDRTLSRYRSMMGHSISGDLQTVVRQDWLNEFERVQYILRLSPRLRQLHGD